MLQEGPELGFGKDGIEPGVVLDSVLVEVSGDLLVTPT